MSLEDMDLHIFIQKTKIIILKKKMEGKGHETKKKWKEKDHEMKSRTLYFFIDLILMSQIYCMLCVSLRKKPLNVYPLVNDNY